MFQTHTENDRDSINTVNEFVLAFIIVAGCRNHDFIPQKVLFIATFTKYSSNEIINSNTFLG